MKSFLLVSLFLLVGCTKKSGNDIPPPIANGKCLVDHFNGAVAMKQTCTHVGYVWACSLATTGTQECTRGAEARGERTPAVPPPPVGSAGSGSGS